jgi:hypothetical protein
MLQVMQQNEKAVFCANAAVILSFRRLSRVKRGKRSEEKSCDDTGGRKLRFPPSKKP